MRNIVIAFFLFACLTSLASNALARVIVVDIQFELPPDTVFVANERDDWQTLDSYITVSDSVVNLELLLTRKVDARTEWEKLTVIGKVDKKYAPQVRTDFVVRQHARTWRVVINEKGRCFIRLVKGREPRRRSTTYVSLKLIYKK